MHVYLKDGKERRWITDVYLLKGFCPCVGSDAPNKNFSDASRMEPAIWCKVLLLESVSVDCNRRMISWSTGRPVDKADGEDNSPNQFTINDECSGYDAEDELFDLARAIIHSSSSSMNKDFEDEYELNILRMLHCFILPKITLHKRDIDKVEFALEQQMQNIQALDNKVIEHCQSLDLLMKKLDKLREDLLLNIVDLAIDGQCSQDNLEFLIDDITKEETRLRKMIDEAQDEVESAKVQLSSGTNTGVLETCLQKARANRDSLNNKLLKVLEAREGLSDVEPPRGAVNCQAVTEYMQKRTKLQKMKDDRSQLLEQKNCALSVREMLDGIMSDLKNKGFSDANDADALGTRATDVMQGVWHPEWQKLGERVATIVNNPDHPIGINFDNFCTEIRETCQELINLGRKNSAIPVDPFPEGITEMALSNAEFYGLQDFLVDSYRENLKSLRARLFHHFGSVTELLSETFNNRDYQFKNRLRLAYEQCFYEKEGSFLSCVYELAHHEHVTLLEGGIRRLKQLPIKLLNLPMKDEWWLEIFEARTRIASLSCHVFEASHREPSDEIERARNITGSYDMIDELDVDDFPQVSHCEMKRFSDTASVRSFFINTVRARSKTMNFESRSASSSDDESQDFVVCDARKRPKSCSEILSSSAPEHRVTLGDLLDKWERNGKHLLARTYSKSYTNMNTTTRATEEPQNEVNATQDTFEDHFGPAFQNILDIFQAVSPMAKLKCLTASLRKITSKVADLRLLEGGDRFSVAVTAEDLLPLLVLMMLQMEPYDAAAIWPQLALVEDLMASFLASGCHGWALTEFQMAQRILTNLCSQF
ncbi:uncharacterized protein LOC116617229 [Nematostella vectensis]|uniref:uncharacterized protein LOC116617229 n=1 Tax=Nematostella vectensis TaxID=45351 RepID=UPI0020773C70|nr:uncharacterized protein LOC116617229 [Nematostella vectensis]